MRYNLGKRVAAICAALAIMGGAAAQTETVYTDSLHAGWDNWSWATVNFAATEFAHGGTKSIGVTTGGWQALYLHHSPLDTSTITGLSFWIHGGTAGGQLLQVQALVNGGSRNVCQLPPLTTGWQKVTLSLEQLGVAGVAGLDGFWIQSRTSANQPTFYVDDAQWDGKPIPNPIHIDVNPAAPIRKIDPRFFSLNAAVWDQSYDTAGTVAMLKQLSSPMLRFPGGSLSDEYHWKTGTSNNNTWAWVVNFDNFAKVAKEVKSSAIITVNYGTGTVQEAADWVRYSNITKAYGFKYWEIGNECYGDWETDHQVRPHDPILYAERAAQYIRAMKAVDPTIKVGIVGSSWENEWQNYPEQSVVNPRTGAVAKGWMPLVLNRMKQLNCRPDFVVHHKYDQLPYQEGDSKLLKSSSSWADDMGRIRQMLKDYLSETWAKPTEILVTEHNSVTSNPGKQSTSLVNALYMCDSMGEAMKTEANMVAWWDLRNGPLQGTNNSPSLYGWRNYGDYGLVSLNDEKYPAFYAAQLLVQFARGGDTVLPATSEYNQLAVHAAKRLDGSYSVMVINKSPDLTLNANIRVPGAPTVLNGSAWRYGIPQDEAMRTGVGNPDIQRIRLALGPDFTYTFPPYSVTVFAIDPTPSGDLNGPVKPTNLVGTALSQTEVKLNWTDASADEDGFKVEFSTDNVKFSQFSTVRANITTATVRNLTRGTRYYFRVSGINARGTSAPATTSVVTGN